MAVDLGFPGVAEDGNDVVAVWRVAQESIHRARNGSGTMLIDLCRAELTDDPLAHMEHYLRKRKPSGMMSGDQSSRSSLRRS